MTIAVMLASDRDPRDVTNVVGLSRAALRRGHRVRLFLLGDGVRRIDTAVTLAAEGVEASLCEADAGVRGIHKSGQPGVFFGSLHDWARLVEDADLVLSFG